MPSPWWLICAAVVEVAELERLLREETADRVAPTFNKCFPPLN